MGVGVTDSENSRIQERRHEATGSVRLVSKDGDIIWSSTQESNGGKFRSAMADVADKIVKQLTDETRRIRELAALARDTTRVQSAERRRGSLGQRHEGQHSFEKTVRRCPKIGHMGYTAGRAVLLLVIVSSVFAQSQLPHFAGETLSGRKLTMPDAVLAHPTVLVIGFTHASGPHCTDWATRLGTEFGSNTEFERYSVIFLEDAPRLVRGMAKSGIKSGVPKQEYDNYLIATEHEKEVKAAVHFEAPDDAYLVLLGPGGTVRWTFHGAVSDDPVRQIRELLR